MLSYRCEYHPPFTSKLVHTGDLEQVRLNTVPDFFKFILYILKFSIVKGQMVIKDIVGEFTEGGAVQQII